MGRQQLDLAKAAQFANLHAGGQISVMGTEASCWTSLKYFFHLCESDPEGANESCRCGMHDYSVQQVLWEGD